MTKDMKQSAWVIMLLRDITKIECPYWIYTTAIKYEEIHKKNKLTKAIKMTSNSNADKISRTLKNKTLNKRMRDFNKTSSNINNNKSTRVTIKTELINRYTLTMEDYQFHLKSLEVI